MSDCKLVRALALQQVGGVPCMRLFAMQASALLHATYILDLIRHGGCLVCLVGGLLSGDAPSELMPKTYWPKSAVDLVCNA